MKTKLSDAKNRYARKRRKHHVLSWINIITEISIGFLVGFVMAIIALVAFSQTVTLP